MDFTLKHLFLKLNIMNKFINIFFESIIYINEKLHTMRKKYHMIYKL